ncbi:NAD(P)-dependent dehydrogenase (short-subunit alcohol dehydrogenase family) [Natronocella acetinitrilica]|uniref:NAD(P)-dependent dehydrogenase (Short-subunit alcohol dehydrogenase family) n=1 Tax=Natronocella acetinitrilica TaxID=414046 RepID=A0AAE3G4R2_9GAMM|nr:SDR family NAD(P)-dependent oxidoreductase [Natronocella acetinitrilica]MCP1675044.1 NAD(P)-dependent dehydrogenase (short-subunit alcohol dehydrogenase family) [Natronocella acetinitrilica]
MGEQEQRVLLISGCSTGIGQVSAVRMQQRGWRVFAGVRREADLQPLREAGVEPLVLDVDNSESIHAAVDTVLTATGGRLNALFNNAGYGQPGALEDLDRAALRAQFETNLFGAHELTCAVLPAMRAAGRGRIVFNSSVLGFAALPFRGAYNASKFAMEGLADTLRMELRNSGIQVSLIEPGPIATAFRANAHRHFKAQIDPQSSVHKETYRAMERRLTAPDGAGGFTLPPESVVKRLIHALEAPRARPRYYVTFPTYLFGTLRRFLSTRMMDAILLRSTVSERQLSATDRNDEPG